MSCVKCGKPATKRFSPDLDIRGIGSCDDCLEDVLIAYAALIQPEVGQGVNLGKQMIEGWQKKLKRGDNEQR